MHKFSVWDAIKTSWIYKTDQASNDKRSKTRFLIMWTTRNRKVGRSSHLFVIGSDSLLACHLLALFLLLLPLLHHLSPLLSLSLYLNFCLMELSARTHENYHILQLHVVVESKPWQPMTTDKSARTSSLLTRPATSRSKIQK